MGPKKKQPQNAYYMFMLHFREEMRMKNVTYPGGLKEIALVAAPEWKKLSKEEKAVYEQMAKEEKQRDKDDLTHKYTTTGKSYHQVDLEAKEKREQEKCMESEIKSTVAFLDKQAIQNYPFFFMHVNYYCRTENGQFIPCELALCRFSFLLGASAVYHTIINPGKIPLGYAYDAKRKSDDTHQIPLPPHDLESENNFAKILANVLRFIQYNHIEKELPPIYTHGSDGSLEAVQDVLDTLCATKGPTGQPFRVYPLHKLFYELRNKARDLVNPPEKVEKVFPVEIVAIKELEKDTYHWYPGIACKTHEGVDTNQFCSLSIVRRWSYILADHCCADLEIEMVPGVHIAHPNVFEKRQHESAQVVVSTREDPKRLSEPIVPTFIDYSKLQPEDVEKHEEENTSSIGRGRRTPCFSDIVRQPNSKGIALQNSRCQANFTAEDFPPVGGSNIAKVESPKSANLPFGQAPVWVAGRGSRLAERGGARLQRGRGLISLTDALSLRDEKT